MLVSTLFGIALVGILLFPAIYALYFKFNRKILFMASCYGLEQIIMILLIGLVSPLIILKIFTFPQLESNESLESIRWLVVAMQFVENYWYLGTFIILLVVPFIVHRKYQDVFVKQRNT